VSGAEKGLNEAQLRAVTHDQGPLLVVAGPGTGKTRVLTHRISHIIQDRGVAPERVLAITFTNQAAREIAARVSTLLGQQGQGPVIGTFHAWALSFLRRNLGEAARLPIDEREASALLSRAMEEAGIPLKDLRATREAVSRIKLAGPGPEDGDRLLFCLSAYQGLLSRHGLWDFDDLLVEALRLLREDPDRGRPHALLVDEFQDVNRIQYNLVQAMAPSTGEVTVIGDPNQSIYGFRGAAPEFLDRFVQDFPQATVIRLETAYRSPQRFLDAATHVIRAEGLVSSRGEGPRILAKGFSDPEEEAAWIARKVDELVGGVSFESLNSGGCRSGPLQGLSGIAVLYRINAMGEAISRAFSARGIPHQRADRKDPFEDRDLRLAGRLWDAVRANHRGGRAYLAARLAEECFLPEPEMGKALSDLSGLSGLILFEAILKRFSLTLPFFIQKAMEKAFEADPEPVSFSSLVREGADLFVPGVEAAGLMSLHAAKGLEFPVVFIAGCENGILPWGDSDPGEERRLFYVGLTRASRILHITWAERRVFHGRTQCGGMSPFLRDIPDGLISLEEARPRPRRRPRQKGLFGP